MKNLIQEYQSRAQKVLEQALKQQDIPLRLSEAMRYSALGGGKRFRALLVYGAGLYLNAPLNKLDIVSSAIECVHAYSLIHDDLPAMDDDDLRRGQATCHIKYDDATAILAGDGLLSFAFDLINHPNAPFSDKQCRLISHQLAFSSGPTGMVGGQMLDIEATGNNSITIEELENIHRRKTGALINSATLCGAYCSDNIDIETLEHLSNYANSIGLAFQVIDDILDIESTTQELGKPSGADINLQKATYPALIGLTESKQLADKLYQQAMESLSAISDNSEISKHNDGAILLQELADLVVNRKN